MKEKTLHKYSPILTPYRPGLMTREEYERSLGEKYLFRTMFVPPLHGNVYVLPQIEHATTSYDEVFVLGNFLGLEYDYNNKKTMWKINGLFFDEFVYYRMNDPRFQTLIGFNEIMMLQDDPRRMLPLRMFHKITDGWLGKRGILKVATTSKGRLVTPGGLSYGLWNQIGRPSTAGQAANILNEIYEGKLYLGESYRTTNKPNYSVDPVFAHPLIETYPSWFYAGEEMPFGQIHGNETYNLNLNIPVQETIMSHQDSLDFVQSTPFGTITVFNQSFFIGVNCGLSAIIENSLYDVFYPYNEVCELDKEIVDKYWDKNAAGFMPWNNIENFEGIPYGKKRKNYEGFYGKKQEDSNDLEYSRDSKVLDSLSLLQKTSLDRIENSQ